MALAINEPILTPEQKKAYWTEISQAARKLNSRPTERHYDELISEIKSSEVKSWKDLSKPIQQALCTHQSGHCGIRKMPNGECYKIPRYCGHCPKCLAMQAEKHRRKFEAAEEKAKEKKPDGQWKMKLAPENSTERDSHKKQIARKHDSMHFEIPSIDNPGYEEIWVWTNSNDPAMGEVADPNKIDWDKVNRENKRTGGNTSYGKGIRPPSKPVEENTERLVIPEIIVSTKDYEEAEKIVYRTNLIHKATTIAEVQDGIIRQTIMEIEALQKAGIKIHAIYDQYLNLEVEKTIEDWNRHVSRWMSRNGSIESIEPKMDKSLPNTTSDFQEYNLDDLE